MPSKLQLYSQLADQTARQLTGSLQAWTGFLTTAARLYKYPYHEQLMIYAQRPEATACADYELWNKTMHRYVRRGSQGIALIDASGDSPRLKYVFDVSDTGGGAQSHRPYLWEYRDEHHDAVTAALERRFAVSADGGLALQLEKIAAQLVDEAWSENQRDILGIVDGSFLDDYDDFNVGAAFRNAAVVSTTYALLSRCGLEPEESFTHEDFLSVFDFNTPSTVAALGTAISQTSERVLRQIEVTIKNYEREKRTERTESHDRAALSEERGLHDSQPDAAGAGGETPGQVREDAEALPAGASPGAVESDAPARDAVPAPAGDRRGGEQPSGADAPGAGEGGGRDGGAESRRPAEMDRPDEQLQGTGGGDDPKRVDLRLSEQPPIVAAEQISLFPTEAEQMEIIMEAERAATAPFAFSLPQEDIATEKAAVGADSSRAFSEVRPEAATPTPPKREITQNEIDAAIQAWNGSIQSKHAVVRHMELHGREKQTAEWLAMEYHARADQPFHISMDGAEMDLSWPKVQRRIAQLIQADRFYTQEEYNNLDDVDPIAAREHLAQAGIVNGEVVDPEALNRDPFLQQVMADAERLAPKEAEDRDTGTPEPKKAKDHTPYKVGDTVYLEDTAYEITAVRDFDVELRDPTLVYPIFRAEARDRFEIALYQDPRNSFLTDYLPLDLNIADGDLQDVLTQAGGLFDQRDKETISSWFRAGESNPRIAQMLSDTCAGQSNTVTMQTGEDADFFATPSGVEIHIQDKYSTRHHVSWGEIARVLRAMYQQEQFGFLHEPANAEPAYHEETTAFYPGERNGLPFDVEIRTLRFDEPEHDPPAPIPPAENFRILDEHLGEGGPKEKFWRNIQAITTLKQIEGEKRQATPEEQHILSQYVGWGGLADAFDPEKSAWAAEYSELKGLLTDAEYTAARGSTLNAHYTSPTVIRAIYEAVGNMGFQTGNILEPSMGVGNFFGMLPEEMRSSRLYGVELDSISGRIAKQLYPKANITVAGFETTDRRDFFDLAVGNVPFGQYQVDDRAYNKLGFSIHNYFFAKALDQVRPGGVVAFVTSRYTMDAKDPTVRKYLAQRAELLGAIRLPNNAFRANAGTDVVSGILFLQKRDHPIDIEPEWVHLDENDDGFFINNYFVEHPEMILGRQSSASTQYGHQDFTVLPIEGQKLSDQLHDAIRHIHGHYQKAELPELGEGEEVSETLPADPDVKNYSFTVVDGEVYYRENSIMVKPDLNATAKERVRGMVELRDCVRSLIDLQMDEYTPDSAITEKQAELNRRYDAFTAKYGLINDRGNRLAFDDDDSYFLLCSLEVLDENGALERKADFFTRRTIKQQHSVNHVDTAVEALGVSIGERACVDLPFRPPSWAGRTRSRRSWRTCGAFCSKTRPPDPL